MNMTQEQIDVAVALMELGYTEEEAIQMAMQPDTLQQIQDTVVTDSSQMIPLDTLGGK